VPLKTVVIVKESMDRSLSKIVSALSDSVKTIRADEDILSLIYMDPPDLIFIDRSYLAGNDARIINEFRSNTIYGHLPIIAVYRKDDLLEKSSIELPVDDFVVLGNPELEIRRRIEFISGRAMRETDTNPLTRLPGNESIIRFIQKMFDNDRPVAIGWIDLDNFKPYNDRYGFASGDEVLLATARILTNAMKEIKHEDTFVGHVGGDDFVFVCPVGHMKELCEEILAHFDMVIRNFYEDEDLEQGGIVSTARTGETCAFSVMTMSIAVVTNEKNHYKHYGEASQDATEIKKYVKGIEGSNYMINRRKTE
jgi:diguanylate cyclase (GGDEF)-like protein